MWLIATVTTLLSVIAVVGNSFVIYVIVHEKMKSSVYKLIASQCTSDIVYAIFRIATFTVCRRHFEWFGTETLQPCEFTTLVGVSMYAISSLSVAALAINRFRKIRLTRSNRPSSTESTKSTKVYDEIALIWFIGLLAGILGSVGHPTPLVDAIPEEHSSCYTSFDKLNRKFAFFNKHYAFILMTIVVVYCPIVIGSILYPIIIKRMRQMDQIMKNRQSVNQLTNQSKMNTRNQTIKMLITILISYYVLTLPIFFLVKYSTLMNSDLICKRTKSDFSGLTIVLITYQMATCVNPFIICYFNPIFRSQARTLFQEETRRAPRRPDSITTVEMETKA